MLLTLTTIKLLAEIALSALLARWILGLITGAKREHNLFWQLLNVVVKPVDRVARLITPAKVIDRHVPMVAFLLVGFCWIAVTMAKISTCLEIGIQLCK
jgi:hypothetical protein